MKELYVDPTTYEVRVKDEKGNDKPLRRERELTRELIERIRRDYSESWAACKVESIHFPKEKREMKALERFCRCNFGMLDGTADVTQNGFELEEVNCPLRGYCRYEFVICKPKLTMSDKQTGVAEAMIVGKSKEGIARALKIPMDKVKGLTYRLRKKFGFDTNSGLVSFFRGAHQERRMKEFSFIKEKE